MFAETVIGAPHGILVSRITVYLSNAKNTGAVALKINPTIYCASFKFAK
ncbi:hypothetical protein [Clostridium botulinum]|nr:hypothetical protein [Clostridium botulinum]MBN3361180.1 hypothetical protein [Clostridium botulinum]